MCSLLSIDRVALIGIGEKQHLYSEPCTHCWAVYYVVQEGRTLLYKFKRTHNRLVTRMSAFPSARIWTMNKFQVSNPMSYTADTTQPDVLDVVFFLVSDTVCVLPSADYDAAPSFSSRICYDDIHRVYFCEMIPLLFAGILRAMPQIIGIY
jgi:hypothetical protein